MKTLRAHLPTILRDFILDLANDEERVARWISSLLLAAAARGFLEITPTFAEDLAAWLAEGVTLVTQPGLTVEDLTSWVTAGFDLVQHHRTLED